MLFPMRKGFLGIALALIFGLPVACRKDQPPAVTRQSAPPADPALQPDIVTKEAVAGDSSAAAGDPLEGAGGPSDTTAPLITGSGIGAVRLGMTLAELEKEFPRAVITPVEDGDGVTWYLFSTGADDTLFLYVGDWDSIASNMRGRGIETIETFSPRYALGSGVRVGALISDAEKKIGRIKNISVSEIEGRQYIEFDGQPEGVSFRIDYTGIFPEGSRETLKYEDTGKIYSITTSLYP